MVVMNILVTGCAGFIGSRVCSLLLEQGQKVVGLDNLNDAYDVRLKQWRLRQLESHPGFHFHNMDISDYSTLRSLFAETTTDILPVFECVVNLAARAGVRYSVENPWVYYQANTIGTLNLLELCRVFDVNKFVLASTSSVYGDHVSRPFKENSDTSLPLSPYAASKKAAETLVYTYHHLHGLNATVLRYFTVYGPAGRPDMSVFKFVRAIAEKDAITVFGDGKQERDFTYIDDIARGTIMAMNPLGYEIINLGSDRPVVLADLIKMIEEYLGKTARIQYAPRHTADVLATWADIGCARSLLGWLPKVSVEDGVARTIQWYEDNRNWAKDIR